MPTTVLGIKELKAECERLARDLENAEDPAAMAAGVPIRDAWKSLVPVLDGNYRDSLTVVWLPKNQAAGIGTSWLGGLGREDQPVMYSKRLEFGYSGTTAQPSARPAMESSKPQALEAGAVPIRAVIKGRRPRRRV